ncbi:MAG: isoleucine--tRNA ligase [Methanobacteriota archaeon]|nr:MAG: isoleucine--tRNA ligase [Euryarchaeota archaeon]
MSKAVQRIFEPVPPQNNFPKMEEEILEYWKKNNVYEKIQEERKHQSKGNWTWLEGPPTANGLPHAGHALTRTLKDIMLRFRTMQGYHVRPRIGGWDCHGLPVELEIEKKMGFNTKQDIENFGIEKFNDLCRESVLMYEKEWREMTERVGFWLDLDHPYITMDDKYIESVWWSLKTLFERGLLYKGVRVAPLCTRCGTTLSSHELSQGYKEVKDPAIFVKFEADDPELEGVKFLAWTTTPWTLLSNVMLSVNPDVTYSIVEYKGEKLIVAEPLIEKVFKKKIKPIRTFKGKELEYKKYKPLFPYFKDIGGNAFIVTVADYVTTEDGTGIVHSAPAFGADDAETGKRYNAPIIQCVDQEGKFTEDVPPLAGLWVKDADKKIIEMLKKENKLFRKDTYVHQYPHCWRCDTPLLYYGTESWFIAMSTLRDKLVENNKKVKWQPKYIRDGRFGNFLENVIDWNLSRSRYWGTPLPIWVCNECGHTVAIGSKQELEEKAGSLPDKFELHRPYVDEIKWDCDKCGKGTMIREEYVIDCWYDSGSAPFAQYHYPFENEEQFKEDFPFDWITEAIDQTRGWFYTLMAVSTALFGKSPYKAVLCMNHIVDEHGRKMSKSKGNTINTKDLFEKVGADSTRWYLSKSPAWNQTRFSINLVEEAQRKMLNTLWNVYSFFVTNANVDNYVPGEMTEYQERPEIDRWILSRLQNLTKEVANSIDEMTFHVGVNALDYFIIEELSNWYVRRSRRRFYKEEMDLDKRSAYDTLYEVLTTLTRLLAPFTPFLAEAIYLNLEGNRKNTTVKSVHAELFPVAKEELIDQNLEEKMSWVLNAVIAGRAARSSANIKMRQPLKEMIISVQENVPDLKDLIPVIAEEINVKKVKFSGGGNLVEYKILPNLKVLAPKVKGEITKIKEYLSTMDKEEAKRFVSEMKQNKSATIEIDGKTWEFTEDEVKVSEVATEGYAMGSSRGVEVFISTKITPTLKLEGLARELVRRIQEMRKSAGLEFTDRIVLSVETDDKAIKKSLTKFQDYILTETQADKLVTEITDGYTQEWKIGDKTVTIHLKKA